MTALAVVVRLVVHGTLDRRPRFTGAEASDLSNLMLHHFAVRDWSSLAGFWTPTDQFKPPLYYAGVPTLLGLSESLSYLDVLLFNVPALLLALWACWRLGRTYGGPWTGLCCVGSVALLPAVVGRSLLVGPDLWLMAAFGWSLYYTSSLLRSGGTRRTAVALGGVVGLGMLVKWTLLLPLVGLVGVAMATSFGSADGSRQRRQMVLAVAVAALLFLPWLLGMARLELFVDAMGSEVSDEAWLQMPPWIFLTVWTIRDGIGPFGAPLVILSAVGAWASMRSSRVLAMPRGDALASMQSGRSLAASGSDALAALSSGGQDHRAWRRTLVWMLLASAGVVYLVHSALPHKEVRYLQSAFLSLGMLLGLGLGSFARRSLTACFVALLSLAILGLGSLLWPLQSVAEPDFVDYFQQEHIYLDLDRNDWGIEDLVRHPSVTDHAAPLIGYFLRGPRYFELRDTISWEFYARNDHAVRGIFPDWRSWDLAALDHDLPLELARQFSTVTHVVNDRPLSARQAEQMARLDFVLLFEMRLPFFRAEFLQFWEKK